MKFFMLVVVLVVCSALVWADEVEVPIGIEFGVSSITIKCANANYVYDKNSLNLSDNITCQKEVNLTTSNQSLNLTCDSEAIALSIANKTGVLNGGTKEVIEALTSAFNDRTQQILNTQRDENNEIKNSITTFVTCNSELSQTKNYLKDAEIRAVAIEGNSSLCAQRLEDKEGENNSLFLMLVGVGIAAIVLVLILISGVTGRLRSKANELSVNMNQDGGRDGQ